MTTTIKNRVAQGAAQLDLHMSGWEHRVDTYLLDMADPHRDVLGQLFGDFETGVARMCDGSIVEANDCGFTTVIGFAELTDEWKRAILARRAGEV